MKSLITVILLLAVTPATLTQVVETNSNTVKQYAEPLIEEITLTKEERAALLVVTWAYLDKPPSEYLSRALTDGVIETLVVEKYHHQDADYTGHQARIRWVPYELTETRKFRPILLCVADGELNWYHCQEGSWIIFQSAEMEKPIILEGELSDQQIARIYESVDEAGLVSETDDEVVTSGKTFRIINYEHTGERVNVYVKTAKEGYTDVIYVKQTSPDDEDSPYELTEFVCGNPT